MNFSHFFLFTKINSSRSTGLGKSIKIFSFHFHGIQWRGEKNKFWALENGEKANSHSSDDCYSKGGEIHQIVGRFTMKCALEKKGWIMASCRWKVCQLNLSSSRPNWTPRERASRRWQSCFELKMMKRWKRDSKIAIDCSMASVVCERANKNQIDEFSN